MSESTKIDITTYPGNIINNDFVSTPTSRHSIDPAIGEPLYEVPVARKEDLDAAVSHARATFKIWSKTTHEERAKLLHTYANVIETTRHDLEKLQTMEQGKPLGLAALEVSMTLQWLRAFTTMQLADEVLEDTDERTVYSTRVPLGVVGAIVPWNGPILLGLGKVGPALMTGNTVLSGDDRLGPWMTEHGGIDMISFTGSIAAGKKVAASCAQTLKRYCLPKIAMLAFLNSGQVCMVCKRIYVHDNIYDKFLAGMVEFTKNNIKMGGGFEPGVVMGPVQNSMQFEFLKDMYAQIEKSGWKAALEDKVRTRGKGYFVEPAIIDNPPEDSRIVVEELFGPIVPLLRWSSEQDVIDRANAVETGLGASVWSRDLARAERMARQLSAGSVWVNSHFDVAPPRALWRV
ncbi:hypothetical protein VTI74DRAFT_10690 [Chaetomium olivicolor]